MIVSGLIFCIDCHGEGFNGSQVQFRYFLGVPALPFEPIQIDPVRAVYDLVVLS